MACVACTRPLEFFGPREGFEYFLCRSCGTIQIHPLPSRQTLADAYRDYERAGHYAASPELAKRINQNNYRAISEALDAHDVQGPVLDYGAGWGGLVEHLLERGLECEGLDSNPTMVATCKASGVPVRQGDLAEVSGRQFAALTLSTVFEHLTDHDRWLEEAHQILEPGGLLVTLNPTARFARLMATLFRFGVRKRELPAFIELYSPPWHTVFFSIRGLTELADRHGFRLLEVRWTPSSRQPGPLGWVQALLERINRVGWWVMGRSWPLQVCHTFVFQKVTPEWATGHTAD